MSDGLDKIRERMADYLNAQGVAAVTAWPAEERLRREGAVAAVTLRACQAGPAGFQSYWESGITRRRSSGRRSMAGRSG